VLVFGLGGNALADTIRLRDGSVIRGQIVAFRDQQFTVLIGSGARGRRSRITLYMEDVESIEFESAGGAAAANANDANNDAPAASNNDTAAAVYDADRTNTTPSNPRPAPAESRSTSTPTLSRPTQPSASTTQPPASAPSSQFFQINVRVRADNTTNGWTNSGLVVRRGQRLRINSSGRISLGGGRFSTPTGLPRVPDENKLMKNDPTGGLIAVIGDDNDSFIFIGSRAEFTAERDGILFLGVNEGNLNDNTGNYEAVIEAEALGGSASR
jgi:hypothetical protein